MFFRRLLPWQVLGSSQVACKDPGEDAIVFGAVQGQHLVGVGHIPPRAGSLEVDMVDELVGRFNPAAPHGVPAPASKPIVDSRLMPVKIRDEFRNLLGPIGASPPYTARIGCSPPDSYNLKAHPGHIQVRAARAQSRASVSERIQP